MSRREQVTEILLRVSADPADGGEELYALVYQELRRLAGSHLRRERPDHTLQATELVHEAYFRLVDQTRSEWRNRAHFFAVASQAMRRILVDHARTRSRRKRGRGWKQVPFSEALQLGSDDAFTTLVALDVALDRLKLEHPDAARVVELCYFGGVTQAECAEVMEITSRTVTRYWNYAQAWLYREMANFEDPPGVGSDAAG